MTLFSIIIPTMQKDIDVLNMLVKELDEDETVGEIVIIDNSLKGYSFESDKINVIIPKKNLFVNPSWNLGVKKTKYDYVGILNDDILIPKNLCKDVMNYLKNTENCGLIGLDDESIKPFLKEEFNSYPESIECTFSPVLHDLAGGFWGSAIFGLKKNFYSIPKNMKIWCGDDFLLRKNLDAKKDCYAVKCGQVKHLGSLTSASEALDEIKYMDMHYYSKINPKVNDCNWYIIRRHKYLTFSERMFSVYIDDTHIIINILGMRISY